jgi:protein-L-isoaspartate(D-aspartate) O-methyltransferase
MAIAMALKLKVKTMLRCITEDCLYTGGLTGIFAFQENILHAMAKVPREKFVPTYLKPFAYDNNPLPIGHGQTISQPFIVALMTELLQPEENHVILEIGTGSGYQAAILATLVSKVYSLEIIPSLAEQAEKRLQQLGFNNVEVVETDGHKGYPQHAPYDGIIVTAAASHIPLSLIEQLKPGGRLVIPVGLPHTIQHLMMVTKVNAEEYITREVLAVSFVPLTSSEDNK